MTTSLQTRVIEAGATSPAVHRAVVLVTSLVIAVSLVWSPPDWLAVGTAVAIVAALGIPHGALDHLAVEAVDGRRPRSRSRFIRDYVLAMLGAGLVWLASPGVALVGFLVVSVHHFGQSDLAYLHLDRRHQLALQWSRGLLLVGLPLVAHVPTIAPVIEDLGGGDPAGWPWLADRWWLWSVALIGQHLLIGGLAARHVGDRVTVVREAVNVALLSVLFLAADPLIGFAVYFGLWHSLGHLTVLARVLGIRRDPVRSVLRLAAPLTAVSLVGLGVAWTVAVLAGRSDLVVPVMFVFVSMLTVPHLVVVERLWRAPTRVGAHARS